MTIQIGDIVEYRSHYILYKGWNDKVPQQGVEIKKVRVIASAKGTDYADSDWIVCKPENYPITDLRSHSRAKHWGISESQIINLVKE